MTINNINYSTPRNLNVKEGAIRFGGTFTATPFDSTSNGLYVNSSNLLVYTSQGSDTTLGAAGAMVNYSLDDAYNDGKTIAVDGAAVTLTGTHATNDTLAITGAGTGALIDLTQASTGKDIEGTGDTWTVSAAGAAVFTAITGCDVLTAAANLAINATDTGTITLAGTSTGAITLTTAVTCGSTLTVAGGADADAFIITAGDVLISDGHITMIQPDNEASIELTCAGVTSSYGLKITADGLTSGAAIYVDSDNGASFASSGGYMCFYNGTTVDLFVGRYGAITISGNATGTASITLTAGDLTMSDGVLSLTQSADAAALTIVADAQTDTNVIDVNADGITTGVLLHLDSSAASFNGKYIQCYDGAADEFSVGLDGATIITTSSAGTIGLTIASGSTTGDAMNITCTALTTGDALQITQTAETFAAGELLKIVNTENGNTAATPKTGNLCSITSSVTQTTASATLDYDALLISRSNISNCDTFTLTAAGSALKLIVTSTNTAGTCTDTTKGLEVLMADGGTAAPTGTAVDITSVGVGAKALNITSASTSVSDVLITGSGVKATTKAVAEITSSGATAAGGAVLRVSATGTPAAATSYLAVFTNAGATCSSNPVAVYINGKDSTAAALQVTGSGASAAGLVELNSTAAGALGAVLAFDQTASSAADDDVIGRLLFTAQDAANAAETYARIDVLIRDKTAANPDAAICFYTDRAGTNTLALTIGWDDTGSAAVNGILLGDGAGTGIVTSNGAYDLTIETNGGTNSGTITITDGANGDITLTPNGTGQVQLFSPSYGQITAGADGAATLTVAMAGLYTIGNTVARTLTLPAVAGTAGLWYTIKKTSADAAAVTIDTPGGETIDGAATNAEVDAQYDSITIVSDGSNWHVVNKKIAA
jgi:hypothetical protein